MTIDRIPEELWDEAERAARKQFPRSEVDQAFFASSYISGVMVEKMNEIIDELNRRRP